MYFIEIVDETLKYLFLLKFDSQVCNVIFNLMLETVGYAK